MRRIVLWFLSTVSAVVLLFGYNTSTAGPMGVTGQTPVVSNGGTPSSSSSGSSGADPNSGSSTSSGSTTVTGSVAQTRWGPVQVELTVDGGTISAVSVLQYPSGNGTDQQINSYALPILVQETVDAQSSNIDMVSGATVTSEGYLESLQSALDSAGL
jgi:uncharacterized protein with FMN-binding domain